MDERIRKLTDRLTAHKSALIVIDVQNDFCHPEGAFGKWGVDFSFVQAVMPRLSKFLDTVREAGLPVIFVRTHHSAWTNSPSWLGRLSDFAQRVPICKPNTWGAELYRIEPQAEEFIVTKHRYSGFVGTDLDLVLRSRGIRTIMVAGFTSNVCVETTARDACNRDYYVIFVDDCCGAPLAAEHEAAKRNMEIYFGLVADASTIGDILHSHRTDG
jgi:ureidoacrylate peracid hydrolase